MECIACNSEVSFLGKNESANIYRCSTCGLGITENTFFEAHDNYHRDAVYDKERELFQNIFAKRLAIISKLKKHGKVLEIGSSVGILLSLLKNKGWKVEGIEPSEEARAIAVKSGIPTYSSTFEKVNLGKEKYDVVILNHVLEHMDDPIKVLKKVQVILRKDGIVLIDVPNFGSLSAGVRKERWRYILPQEHKFHFTKNSLASILNKADMVIIYSETHSGIWECQNPLAELVYSLLHGKKRFFNEIIYLIPDWIVSKLGLGTSTTIIAKKK